jgi:hypothetical protein
VSDRVEPVGRRRGPVAPVAIAPVRDQDRRDAADPDARRRKPRPRPAAQGGITHGPDGRAHVDLQV